MKLDELLLVEGVGTRKLYHHADVENMLEILKKKKLIKSTMGGPSGFPAVRNAKTNKPFTVIIDGSKLSDTVRGAKIKPVNTKQFFAKQVAKFMVGGLTDEKVNAFMKEVEPLIKPYIGKNTKMSEMKFQDNKEKELIDKYKFAHRGKMYAAAHVVLKGIEDSREKDGEEMIDVDTVMKARYRRKDIPLDPNYTKIEINKIPEGTNFQLAELADSVKRNRRLFVQNSMLDQMIGAGKKADETEQWKLKKRADEYAERAKSRGKK